MLTGFLRLDDPCTSLLPSSEGQVTDAGSREPLREGNELKVALLTGGGDKHYAWGLARALASKDVSVDLIGSDELDCPELQDGSRVTFLNLRGSQLESASRWEKVSRVLRYYARLIRYASASGPRVFHILWNNKFETFDRTLLMAYYKLMGKKIVFTAHNVNAGTRDANDSVLNRVTLRIQYSLADHILVHTDKMKSELQSSFDVPGQSVTVIPFGINDIVPNTGLAPADAKTRLGIGHDERTILFFGNIAPYKGLEFLLGAFRQLATSGVKYRLIVAGRARGGPDAYPDRMREMMNDDGIRGRIIQRIEHIPDEETELYFKAADVVALPYKHIFQSGVLFMAYSFGLPVIATDVGSLREDVAEGQTGFLCSPGDPDALAEAIEKYFESPLFRSLSDKREGIREYARKRNSGDLVGDITRGVYAGLLGVRARCGLGSVLRRRQHSGHVRIGG
jgi:D-inositol-3-phosphate glycosyltransferase